MSFYNVTDLRLGEEFVLSDRAFPVSEWQDIAGEWWVCVDAKRWKFIRAVQPFRYF